MCCKFVLRKLLYQAIKGLHTALAIWQQQRRMHLAAAAVNHVDGGGMSLDAGYGRGQPLQVPQLQPACMRT